MEQQLENLLEVNSLYLNHSNNNKGRVAYSFTSGHYWVSS